MDIGNADECECLTEKGCVVFLIMSGEVRLLEVDLEIFARWKQENFSLSS